MGLSVETQIADHGVYVRITENGVTLAVLSWVRGVGSGIIDTMPATQPDTFHPAPAIGLTGNPLCAALESWRSDMERRGAREASIRQFVKRVRNAAAACGWRAPADIRYDQAAEWLARERKAKEWSGTTTDGVVSALRCFARFCHAAGLVTLDPLLALNRSGEQGGPGERALTVEEVRALVTIASAATARDRRARCPRGLYYGFLALTGLRTIEAGKCTWGDLDLLGDPPALYSDPKWAKNGKRQRVCLCPEIVEKLSEWGGCVPSGRSDPVFPESSNRATWIKDRIAAGIPEVDGRGRRCGLHSLRKAFCTMLYATGASDATISRLARHESSITQSRYIDPDCALEVEAVRRLPKIFACGQLTQVPLCQKLRNGAAKKENMHACGAGEVSISSPSDPVTRSAHPHENNPPVRQTNGVASRGSPPGGLFSVDEQPARESSAARRESRLGDSRDENRPRLQPRNGHSRSANDPVLIFAQAVELLGRLLESRRVRSPEDAASPDD